MITFFKEIFEYNHQMNQMLIGTLIENEEKASEKAFQLLCHIVNVHMIWNSRILNESLAGTLGIHPIKELQKLDTTNYQNTLSIIQKSDLSNILEYSDMKGNSHRDLIRDILFQSINHSTYHRAQIATECRQTEIEPLITDYIFYKWGRKEE
ncbi:damage-inducible protein DinB [Pedobacter sp. PAMC26386]|nr:damage-inducible protein DinB [Pedobacter sp. PAMC26386]